MSNPEFEPAEPAQPIDFAVEKARREIRLAQMRLIFEEQTEAQAAEHIRASVSQLAQSHPEVIAPVAHIEEVDVTGIVRESFYDPQANKVMLKMYPEGEKPFFDGEGYDPDWINLGTEICDGYLQAMQEQRGLDAVAKQG